MTVPSAPFDGREPSGSDSRPHALVLIGDGPHEPGHLEEGLRPVFEATGVVAHFTVDVRALSAENLAKVRLLVILRDGLQRPGADAQSHYKWMTPEQERAVVSFVEGGGGFLNLHNSMGLYPEHGPYLELVGGRYIGHGPLERFRVEVVDSRHPVTRGVSGFFTADEQHTPPYDEGRVHLLLRNRSDDGKSAAAGWVREPGAGGFAIWRTGTRSRRCCIRCIRSSCVMRFGGVCGWMIGRRRRKLRIELEGMRTRFRGAKGDLLLCGDDELFALDGVQAGALVERPGLGLGEAVLVDGADAELVAAGLQVLRG